MPTGSPPTPPSIDSRDGNREINADPTMPLSAADKLEIHEVINRAAWAYDEARLDVTEACFAADAVMTVQIAGNEQGGSFAGRDAIVDLIRSSIDSQQDQRRHVMSNVFFEDADAARPVAVSTLTLVVVADGAARVLSTGTYRDTCVREDDAWRIVRRELALDLPY